MRRQSSFIIFIYLVLLFYLFPFSCFNRNQLLTGLLIESCTGLGVDLILFSVFQIFLVAGLKKKKKDVSVDRVEISIFFTSYLLLIYM